MGVAIWIRVNVDLFFCNKKRSAFIITTVSRDPSIDDATRLHQFPNCPLISSEWSDDTSNNALHSNRTIRECLVSWYSNTICKERIREWKRFKIMIAVTHGGQVHNEAKLSGRCNVIDLVTSIPMLCHRRHTERCAFLPTRVSMSSNDRMIPNTSRGRRSILDLLGNVSVVGFRATFTVKSCRSNTSSDDGR